MYCVGIRLSPYGVFNGSAPDAQTDAVYLALVAELGKRKPDMATFYTPGPKGYTDYP